MPLHDLCKECDHKPPEAQIMNIDKLNEAINQRINEEQIKRLSIETIATELKKRDESLNDLKEINNQLKTHYESQITILKKLADENNNHDVKNDGTNTTILNAIKKKEKLLSDLIQESMETRADNVIINDDIDKSIIEPPALIIPKRGSIKKTSAKAWK